MLANLITYTLYLLTATIPLVFTTWNYELFEFPKFVALIAGSFFIGILMLSDHILTRKNPLNLLWYNASKTEKILHSSVLVVLVTQALSTIFSVQLNTSLWGYYSRFHQGLIATFCYTVVYFAIVLYLNKKSTQNIIKVSIATSIVISFYAIAEHYGIDKNMWVQDVQNRVFSTLGQPNWLAAYLLPNLFLTLYYNHIKKHQGYKLSLLHDIIFIVLFVALLFTKSRSGLLAFGVSYVLYWALMLRNFGWHKVKPTFRFISLSCFLFIIFIGTPLTPTIQNILVKAPPIAIAKPIIGPALETGGTESGEIRKIVWSGALQLFKQHPILGTGPETFAYTYYQVRPVSHNYVSEWDFLYNKAHNEYLNIAANTGIIGLAGYLFYHLAILIAGFVKPSKNHKNQDDLLVHNLGYAPVLVASIASFFITNFFGFSVIPVYFALTLLAGLATTLTRQPSVVQIESDTLLSSIAIIFALSTLILPLRLYIADSNYAKGKAFAEAGKITSAIPLLELAHQSFPNFDLYLTTLSESYATLSVAATLAKDPYIAKASGYSQLLLRENPIHQNNLKSAAKVNLTLASLDPKYYQLAAQDLELASSLAPTDPKGLYNLGLIYNRLGQNDKAIESLQKAIAIRTIYAEPYYALTLIYEENNQKDKIPTLLQLAKENLATYSAQLAAKIEEYGR
ncbi:MAG: O-antigen ligase family protein [bacterium]